MKKLVLAIAALGLISLTSCKKNYTCVCNINMMGMQQTYTSELGKQKKSDAESMCSSKFNTVAMPGMTVTGSCELK